MRLIVVEPLGSEAPVREQRFYFPAKGLPLKVFLQPYLSEIDTVSINGVFERDWREYVPDERDAITVFPRVSFVAGGFAAFLGSLLVSLAVGLLSALLTPTPKSPKSGFQPAFAVPGLTNTISPGAPKLMVFGERRIFPGVIGSQARILPNSNGRRVEFRVLYFCGVGPIGGVSDIELDGVSYLDIPDVRVVSRLGDEGQSVIPGWEHCHQIYPDGRTIARGKTPGEPGEPIFWTTRSRRVNRVTFFLHWPSGNFGTRKSGSRAGTIHDGQNDIRIRYKKHGEPDSEWADIVATVDGGPLDPSPFDLNARRQDAHSRAIQFDLPEDIDAFWDFEYTMLKVRDTQTSGDPIMVNAQETLFFTTNYEGSALLEVRGIGSEQVNSLENLKTSCVACGILVEKPDPLMISPLSAEFQCCPGEDNHLVFTASGNFVGPLQWSTTKGVLTVTPDGMSAILRAAPVPMGIATDLAYGMVANYCFAAGATTCLWTGITCDGNVYVVVDPRYCTATGSQACFDLATGGAGGSCSGSSNEWTQFRLPGGGICQNKPTFSSGCEGLQAMHYICDQRTPQLIEAGCVPCKYQFESGAVVTVQDAAGQFASAIITGSKTTGCAQLEL